MAKLRIADLKKTYYYLRRNGIVNTAAAAMERLEQKRQDAYVWIPPTEEALRSQREWYARLSEEQAGVSEAEQTADSLPLFSIVVPTFRTPEAYLRRMIDSVLGQTYPKLELVLADATDSDAVKLVTDTYNDSRIRYVKLAENAGIAENTNRGIEAADGDYIGLLDHDDVLTEDALYEMANRILTARKQGITLEMLYSDEDKCDGEEKLYFDPHYKEDFNFDLLLSNNYICHFLVMKSTLMKKLGFRQDFDGAQDFDLALRAAVELKDRTETIAHIDKVLYHWRCHVASTADNPRSKAYAYEAGLRAVQAAADCLQIQAVACESKHLGFYRLQYNGSLLQTRKDLAAVGGPIIRKGKIAGGRMDAAGKIYYEGLPKAYSGYLHRAVLMQDAQALDIRNITVAPDLRPLFETCVGVPYKCEEGSERFDCRTLPADADCKELSLRLSKALLETGRKLLYLPENVG